MSITYGQRVVALAGNPNVGKSTVFNALTGMNQHTGNWPGKTVANARGTCHFDGNEYILVDLPGTYSLAAHSAEEEIARDFLLYGEAGAVIVVCDATCLERNLNLALQIMEITPRVLICVNLMDEAKKKNIRIDPDELERELGVPVVGTSARSGKGLRELMKKTQALCSGVCVSSPKRVRYPDEIEQAVRLIYPVLERLPEVKADSRWLALRLLDDESAAMKVIECGSVLSPEDRAAVESAAASARELLGSRGIGPEELKDMIVSGIVLAAEDTTKKISGRRSGQDCARDRKLDRILTSRLTGIPVMLALLCFIFWLTITGANYPSQLLANLLFGFQDSLSSVFSTLNAPDWLHGLLVLGMYRVLAWVVSVMLPPMAIFFPLFTLLEDFGYLPRVAFNLDYQFKKAKACGKQALTMCMGFGCNAAGVVGCRIIDSPRERLIAIITNNFVPCNGRFAPPSQEQLCPVNQATSVGYHA